MIRSLIAILGLGLAVSAQAMNMQETVVHALTTPIAKSILAVGTPGLAVGDTSTFNVTIGTFITGTATMTIKSIDSSTIVLEQDMDLSITKQNCEITMSATSGAISKLTCNGQDQTVPATPNYTVEETSAQSLTVPAGTFQTEYTKMKNNSDNTEVQEWAAPRQVPIGGTVKSIEPSQMGDVTMLLASFKKN